MEVTIHLKEQSRAIIYKNVLNAYTKGDMYCIYKENKYVDKYPICDIFRITESYN